MLLCSDSSSEDDGAMNFTGLERHREALAAGLPEWDDSQSHSSILSHDEYVIIEMKEYLGQLKKTHYKI